MMRPALVVAVVAGIALPLQGATLWYVVQIEHRLTRLETTAELAPRLRPGVELEGRLRLGAGPQTVDNRH